MAERNLLRRRIYLVAALSKLWKLGRGPIHQIDALRLLRGRLRLRPFRRRRPGSPPIKRRRRRDEGLRRDDRRGPSTSGTPRRRGVDAAEHGADRPRDGVGPETAEVVEVVEVGRPEGGATEAVLGDVFGLGRG